MNAWQRCGRWIGRKMSAAKWTVLWGVQLVGYIVVTVVAWPSLWASALIPAIAICAFMVDGNVKRIQDSR